MKDLPIFAGVTPAEFELITSAAREKHISDGEIIFKQRSPAREVLLLLSGSIELTFSNWISETRETISPGASFNNYDGTARAVEACWILVWDRAEFVKLLIHIPKFATNVLKDFRHRAKEVPEVSRTLYAVRGEAFLSRDFYKIVFGWLLVGTVAFGIWEIIKQVYK